MGRTIAEKILSDHCGKDVRAGGNLEELYKF